MTRDEYSTSVSRTVLSETSTLRKPYVLCSEGGGKWWPNGAPSAASPTPEASDLIHFIMSTF